MTSAFEDAYENAEASEDTCEEEVRITMERRGQVEGLIRDLDLSLAEALREKQYMERKVQSAQSDVDSARREVDRYEMKVELAEEYKKKQDVAGGATLGAATAVGTAIGCAVSLGAACGIGAIVGAGVGAAVWGGLAGAAIESKKSAERILEGARSELQSAERILQAKKGVFDRLNIEHKEYEEDQTEMNEGLTQIRFVHRAVSLVLAAARRCKVACGETWARAREIERNAQGTPVFLESLVTSVMEILAYFPHLTNAAATETLAHGLADTTLNGKMALLVHANGTNWNL